MSGVRISLQTRLTLVYGSLFLVMGIVLEAATYLVVARAVNARLQIQFTNPPDAPPQGASVYVESDIYHQIAEQKRAILNQLIQSSVLALIAVAVLAVVLGYVVSGRMLRPLQQITATGRRLSESTLHERIALTGPRDEIKELADTFDGMLDRLHRAFDSQSRFIANASHELRTPLAINRAIIDVAAAKPAAPEAVKTLSRKLLRTIDRQERLLDGLLLLARSERELQERSPVDLASMAANAIEQLAEVARAAGVTIAQTLRPARTTGDLVLLERCAVNLVENAVKYNSADARVWVRTGEAEGLAWLQVENTGPPVSAELAETVFEPFRRLRPDRVGSARGAGLGLSIVRAVMQAHEGSVQACPRPSGGLVITLQLAATRRGSTRIPEGTMAAR